MSVLSQGVLKQQHKSTQKSGPNIPKNDEPTMIPTSCFFLNRSSYSSSTEEPSDLGNLGLDRDVSSRPFVVTKTYLK